MTSEEMQKDYVDAVNGADVTLRTGAFTRVWRKPWRTASPPEANAFACLLLPPELAGLCSGCLCRCGEMIHTYS